MKMLDEYIIKITFVLSEMIICLLDSLKFIDMFKINKLVLKK